MSKLTKCKSCGNYEIKFRAIGQNKINCSFPELDVPLYMAAEWKWCKLKNNWCRFVASHCDFIAAMSAVKEPKIKQENLLNEIMA